MLIKKSGQGLTVLSSMLAMPYQFPVLVDFFNAMKGNAVNHSFVVKKFEDCMAFLGEDNLLQRYQDNPVLKSVVEADFEIALAKFVIPEDFVQQFPNGHHGLFAIHSPEKVVGKWRWG